MLRPARQLGYAIRNLRQEKEISQEKLALKADIQRTYLSEIERGVRNPNLETLVKLAHALEIRASQLLATAETFGKAPLEKTEEHIIIDELKSQIEYLQRRLRAQRIITKASVIKLGEIPKHSHVALFYSDVSEQIDSLRPFFQQSLAQNKRCVYVCDETHPSEFLDGLKSDSWDFLPYLRSGALQVLNKYDTYLCQGSFCKMDTMAAFRQLAEQTIEQGYDGLRTAAEMTWALRQSTLELLEYEHLVQNLFPEFDLVGICLYNRKRFPRELLRQVLLVHPVIGERGQLMNNCFYSADSEDAPDEVELLLEINRLCTRPFSSV